LALLADGADAGIANNEGFNASDMLLRENPGRNPPGWDIALEYLIMAQGGKLAANTIPLRLSTTAARASETFKAVLKNEAEVFSLTIGRNVMLGELHGGEDGPYMPLGESSFSVADMDWDEIPEVVLHVGDNIVLHYKEGAVYAYTFGARAMQQLRRDGSFHVSSGAASGQYRRVKEFYITANEEDEEYEVEVLGEYDAGSDYYVIMGEPVPSEEEFERKIAESIGDEFASQYDFTEENIERELTW
jgi:hypothetical protein